MIAWAGLAPAQDLTQSWYERWMKESFATHVDVQDGYTIAVKYFLSDRDTPIVAVFAPNDAMLCHYYVELKRTGRDREYHSSEETDFSETTYYEMIEPRYLCGETFVITKLQVNVTDDPAIDKANCDSPYGTTEFSIIGDQLVTFTIDYTIHEGGTTIAKQAFMSKLIE